MNRNTTIGLIVGTLVAAGLYLTMPNRQATQQVRSIGYPTNAVYISYLYDYVGASSDGVYSRIPVSNDLLWFERPYVVSDGYSNDPPHAIDACYLMLGTLERAYSMGRTTTKYLKTWGENVSKYANGTDTNTIITTPMINVVITYTNGTQGVLTGTPFPAGSTTTWKSGYWTWSTQGGAGAGYIQYYENWSTVRWIANPCPPCTLNAYLEWTPRPDLGQLYAAPTNNPSYTNYTYTTHYSYITNEVGLLETNMVRYAPNYTYEFPPTIRADIEPRGWDYFNGSQRWIMGTDSIYNIANWDPQWGITSNTPVVNWINYHNYTNYYIYMDYTPQSGHSYDNVYQMSWWTNYVALDTGVTVVAASFSTTNICYTNFPPSTNWFWQTNVLWFYGMQTNSTVNNTTRNLPFERDSNQYLWSTNSLNDMARSLACLQWQRKANYNFERIQIKMEVRISGTYDLGTEAYTCNITTNWITTYPHSGGPYFWSYMNGTDPLPPYNEGVTFYYHYYTPNGSGNYISHGFFYYNFYGFTYRSYMTNSTPFYLTNIVFQSGKYYIEDSTTIEGEQPYNCRPEPEYWVEKAWSNNPMSRKVYPGCPPNGKIWSDWAGLTPAEFTNYYSQVSDTICNTVAAPVIKGGTDAYLPGSEWTYIYGWNQADWPVMAPGPFWVLEQWNVQQVYPYTTYRVLFETCTNLTMFGQPR